MRSFSKKLAAALAVAAMVVTMVPAADAKAAEDFSLNRTSYILYTNEDSVNNHGSASLADGLYGNVNSFDFNLKNKPADWKTAYGYKWTSSNNEVAKVATGGVVTAVSVGKATISCIITDKATDTVAATLTADVQVKANAAEVEMYAADGKEYDGAVVVPGTEIDFHRNMYDENNNKTNKKGTYVTDNTRWMVEPANKGVTVNQSNGVYTFGADAAGEYTLWCETYQSDTYNQATATSEKVVVTVKADVEYEVAQKNLYKWEITAGQAITAADVKVVKILNVAGVDYELPVSIKAPVVKDGKVTVEFFNKVSNNDKYIFTVNGETVEKVASAGAVETIKVTADATKGDSYPLVTAGGAGTTLVATLYDANNVDVTANYIYDGSASYLEFSEKTPSEDGKYSVGATGTIWFEEASLQADVVVVFHSGKYDDNGDEVGNKTNDKLTFASVAAATIQVEGLASYTIKDVNDTDTKKTSLPLNTVGSYLEVKPTITGKKADETAAFVNGDAYLDYGVVSFEETDNSVFAISRGSDATIYTFREGDGRVIVYLTNDKGVKNAIGIVPIKVTPANKLTSVTLEKNTVTVGMVEGLDTATVKFVAKDYYKNDWKEDIGAVEITAANTLAKKVTNADAIKYEDGVIKIDGSEFEEAFLNNALTATLSYKIKVANKWESTLSVTVKKINPNASATYSIEATDGAWGDVSRTSDKAETQAAKTITLGLYEMNNGVKVGGVVAEKYVDKAQLTVEDNGKFFVKVTKGATDVTAKGDDYVEFVETSVASGSATAVTLKFSTVDNNGYVNYDVMGAGNYTVTLYQCVVNGTVPTYRTLKTVNGSTTVSLGSYSYVALASDKAAGTDDASLRACFTINGRDNKATTNADFTVDATESAASNTIFVKSITFNESVGDAKVAYKVDINKAVKLQ